MMHESTVVGLSGPCHHQPPTCPGPTHPLRTPASEISLDLSPFTVPPCNSPPNPYPQDMMRRNPNPISRAGQGKLAAPCREHAPARGRGRRQGHGRRGAAGAAACRSMTVVRICAASSPIKPIIRMQQPSGRLGMKQTSGPFLPPKPRLRVDITHWMERNLPHRPH